MFRLSRVQIDRLRMTEREREREAGIWRSQPVNDAGSATGGGGVVVVVVV